MKYIQELRVNKFRGIKDLHVTDLEDINLFVGSNNSGKTSVLEAIELFSRPFDISNYARVSRMRDPSVRVSLLPLIDYVLWLFPKRSVNESLDNENGLWDNIEINAIINDKEYKYLAKPLIKQSLKSKLKPNKNNGFEQQDLFDDDSEVVRILELNVRLEQDEVINRKLTLTDHIDSYLVKNTTRVFNSFFISPMDHRIRAISAKAVHDVIISGDRPKIINIMKLFDEDIRGIEILSPDGRFPIPAINHKKLGVVPIFLFGDGLRKAFTLASAVVRSEGGVLLIDELETAIHPNALKSLFSWLVQTCKLYNVQLFATTHSLEATDAILGSTEECLDRLAIYRLESNHDKTLAKRFSGNTFYSLRNELGQDVR